MFVAAASHLKVGSRLQQLCHAGGAQHSAARCDGSTQQARAVVAARQLHNQWRAPKAGGVLVECAAAQQQL